MPGGLDAHRPANFAVGRGTTMLLDVLLDEFIDRPLFGTHVIHCFPQTLLSRGSDRSPWTGLHEGGLPPIEAGRTHVLLLVAYQTLCALSRGLLNEFSQTPEGKPASPPARLKTRQR